jgi:hypothetical protein
MRSAVDDYGIPPAARSSCLCRHGVETRAVSSPPLQNPAGRG